MYGLPGEETPAVRVPRISHSCAHTCQISFYNYPILHVFGMWGKPEHPEDSHGDTGWTYSTHFLMFNVTSKNFQTVVKLQLMNCIEHQRVYVHAMKCFHI